MTFDEFQIRYLDELHRGQEYEVYGYKPVRVMEFMNASHVKAQAVSIIRMRAESKTLSSKRCANVVRSRHLWELKTDGGVRFLYFQDGPRRLIVVSATYKMKEKKFNTEIDRAEQLRCTYVQQKEEAAK